MSNNIPEDKKLKKMDVVAAGVFLVLTLALVSAFINRGVEEIKKHTAKTELVKQHQNKATKNVINYQNQR